METIEDIMINNRICLQPQNWELLYQAIKKAYPERVIVKPLILAAWHHTSDTEKRNRFCMHLEYDITAGVAEGILKNVAESDWYSLKE